MKEKKFSCPLEAQITLQKYFMENRSRLLDIAAYMDRVERSQNSQNTEKDFRWMAFHKAIEEILKSNHSSRVERVHEIFSDLTDKPLDSAEGLKGAYGAYPGRCC